MLRDAEDKLSLFRASDEYLIKDMPRNKEIIRKKLPIRVVNVISDILTNFFIIGSMLF